MSLSGSEKEKNEKLASMWLYTRQMGGGGLPPPPSSLRKIKLIPSTCTSSPPAPPTAAMMLAPPPPLQYRTMSQPYMRPPPPPPHIPLLGPLIYAPRLTAGSVNSLHTTYQTQKGNKSADVNSQRRRRRAAAAAANGCGGGSNASRPGKANANRRQRRKSEADIVDGGNNHGAAAFTYTGLDRLIADSFLARQEQSNAGSSHIDYSSSTSSSSSSSPAVSECGRRPALSRSSSKTKIVCRDVKM